MIDINKEAEEYSSYDNPNIPFRFGNHDYNYNETHKETFIAGHNSKATQAKILQAQIDLLYTILKNCYLKSTQIEILQYLNKFQEQLEQLEEQ